MKQLFLVLLLLCTVSVSAQDVIVKKDGSTIVCRVVELTESEIVYKKWGNLNGSSYVMERSAASAINYQNGKKVNLSEATNLYTPYNQNDGTQQYNDRALLALDAAEHESLSKKLNTKVSNYKGLRTIGWVGGAVLTLAGVWIYSSFSEREVDKGKPYQRTITNDAAKYGGISCIALGIGWTTFFLIRANKAKNNVSNVNSSVLLKYDLPISNGSSLSIGADLLSESLIGNSTLGLGLRYNF